MNTGDFKNETTTIKTITFKDRKCASDPIDKSIFKGNNNTMIHIISDHIDHTLVCASVCTYISKAIGEDVYPCGTPIFKRDHNSLEITLQISFH